MNKLWVAVLSLMLFGGGCVRQQITTSSTMLDLSNRGLTAIPMEVFTQTQLTSLDLSQNRLTQAPPSEIGKLEQLVTLDLSNNQLTGLPAELGRLKKLHTLDVSQNALTGLPMELGQLTQLRVLDLTGNPYSEQDLRAIEAKLPNTDIRK